MKTRLTGLLRTFAAPPQPWRPEQPYPALAQLDLKQIARQSGVYVLWHLGVRPRWIRAGGAADLGMALTALRETAAIKTMLAHDGVYAAWALLPAAEAGPVVAHLAKILRPALQSLVIPGEITPAQTAAIPFPLPPGTQATLRPEV